jgi:hypothetical protein
MDTKITSFAALSILFFACSASATTTTSSYTCTQTGTPQIYTENTHKTAVQLTLQCTMTTTTTMTYDKNGTPIDNNNYNYQCIISSNNPKFTTESFTSYFNPYQNLTTFPPGQSVSEPIFVSFTSVHKTNVQGNVENFTVGMEEMSQNAPLTPFITTGTVNNTKYSVYQEFSCTQ